MGLRFPSIAPDMTAMLPSFHLWPRRGLWRRPTTTLMTPSRLRSGVRPPSLSCAPSSIWQRALFWLLTPAPREASPPLNRLPAVRVDFLTTLGDIASPDAEVLRERIGQARSLRELWHARAEVFRIVGVAHSQAEADQRLTRLDRHFPTRAPRSQFAPL